MDNTHFNRMKTGLEEAIAFMNGDATRVTLHKVPILNVKALRQDLGMTQNQFAQLIGSTQQTVASWEQTSSQRCPVGPTQKLLFLLRQNPGIVQDLQQLPN
ncbi:helix-turn-helix domain-containing protein [Oscillatoria sp. CS-180]|uniref:helix-turn-helix domain-containing protein n=1 Tax=Oscillatoria sp. CS-180 TaxID=3021720 RepID=UPI00232D2C7E|nr:helix-turn-helix domain-containing protein [Oscillatoria sp. CS-180]MDB9529072.1 helix-turn-helix domain-containing protein [Oscillatoria sp. CS-180]